MTSEKLMQIYALLYERFGRQCWWPGETVIEIIVGAILTQNTNWANVEKAIHNLKAADSLNADRLYKMSSEALAELIRPAGYYNIKACRLKNFLDWLFEKFDGNPQTLRDINTETLRVELLGINGIGPETADSILLYAFNRPVFVVDTYTFRIMTRHMLIESEAGYEQLRELFEGNLPAEQPLFNEYHALLVKAGKEYCRPKAKCQNCPLEKLPHCEDDY